jgi:excisionase family DNA binding protein
LADVVGVGGFDLGAEPHLMRSSEVAVLFDVTERTVINWAASGKLAALRTAGRHLRFRSRDVMMLLDSRAGSATG